MSIDWAAAQASLNGLSPAQREYWSITLQRLRDIEHLVPSEVAAKMAELQTVVTATAAVSPKVTAASTQRLVHQLTHQLAGQLYYDEGQAVSQLADPLTQDRAALWATLHSARKRLGREQPPDPQIEKSLLKQAMPSEELCTVWRCLAGLLLIEIRAPELVKKWRLELSEALEGVKTARGRRLKKIESDILQTLTPEERSRFDSRKLCNEQ